MATLAQDDFNRSDRSLDGDTMSDGSNTWAIHVGSGWSISSNIATGGYGNRSMYCDTVADTANVRVHADAQGGSYGGPAARMVTGATTAYFAVSRAGFTYTRLFKEVAGSATQLGSNGPNTSAGDVITVECDGTSISAEINGTPFASVTDSAISTGRVGLMAIAGNAGKADDWIAESIEAGGGATYQGTVTLAAASTMSAAAVASFQGSSTLQATVTLSSVAFAVRQGSAVLEAVSELTAAGVKTTAYQGSVTLEAVSELLADGVKTTTYQGSATLEAVSELTADGVKTGSESGSVTLSATCQLTSSPSMRARVSVSMSASVELTASAIRVCHGDVTLSGASELNPSAVAVRQGSTTLEVSAELTSTGLRVAHGSVTFEAVSALVIVLDPGIESGRSMRGRISSRTAGRGGLTGTRSRGNMSITKGDGGLS